MSFISLLLLSIVISFDVMAVSAISAVSNKDLKIFQAGKTAFLFAFSHGAMIFIGYLLGSSLEKIISGFDHWIAFLLLLFLGLKTIFSKDKDKFNLNKFKVLILLALATSINALVLGITFALIDINIYYAILVVFSVVFILVNLSFYLAKFRKKFLAKRVEIISSLVLIAIGLKIILSHLFVL